MFFRNKETTEASKVAVVNSPIPRLDKVSNEILEVKMLMARINDLARSLHSEGVVVEMRLRYESPKMNGEWLHQYDARIVEIV